MASAIDTTKPAEGNPTTQSVRNNFASAKSEIESLQTAVAALPDAESWDSGAIQTGGAFTANTRIYAKRIGKVVSLEIIGSVAPSTPSTLAYFDFPSALPASFRPTATLYLLGGRMRRAGSNQSAPGMLGISTGGVLTFYSDATAGSNFTTTGDGLPTSTAFSYPLR